MLIDLVVGLFLGPASYFQILPKERLLSTPQILALTVGGFITIFVAIYLVGEAVGKIKRLLGYKEVDDQVLAQARAKKIKAQAQAAKKNKVHTE